MANLHEARTRTGFALGGGWEIRYEHRYNHAIQIAKGFHMEGSAQERDGKLYFTGMVKNQDEVNKIWDAIKTVPDWRNDIVGGGQDRSQRQARHWRAPTP